MNQMLAKRLTAVSTLSRSHRRLAKFVGWIKPEPDTATTIREQASNIRRVISLVPVMPSSRRSTSQPRCP